MVMSMRRAKAMSSGSVECPNFVGAASSFGHSITNQSLGSSGAQPSPRACTRMRAKRERNGSAVPSRHVIVVHARFDNVAASAAAVILPALPLTASTNARAGTAAVPNRGSGARHVGLRRKERPTQRRIRSKVIFRSSWVCVWSKRHRGLRGNRGWCRPGRQGLRRRLSAWPGASGAGVPWSRAW